MCVYIHTHTEKKLIWGCWQTMGAGRVKNLVQSVIFTRCCIFYGNLSHQWTHSINLPALLTYKRQRWAFTWLVRVEKALWCHETRGPVARESLACDLFDKLLDNLREREIEKLSLRFFFCAWFIIELWIASISYDCNLLFWYGEIFCFTVVLSQCVLGFFYVYLMSNF